MKTRTKFLITTSIFIVAIWANNTSLFTRLEQQPTILAHRAAAQTYAKEGLQNDTCTADRIYTPKHQFLENTIASIRYAFSKGAHIVEFDIHKTTDGKLAIYHDWTLDCRTEAKGITQNQSMAFLKTLDIGHGYTSDGGKTFPFRGKFIGQMPEISEIFETFPNKNFLINIKSNNLHEATLLADKIKTLPIDQQNKLTIYGGKQKLHAQLNADLPHISTMNKPEFKDCAKQYLLLGWSGYIPETCHNTMFIVPHNYKNLIWGWPNKFIERMASVNTSVFVMDDYTGRNFSKGLPTIKAKALLAAGYKGGIWTDDIDEF
ncbi:MAG: glycerophosphodiester phosphodiesterase family protein [Hyphomicrobiales bacterium]